MVHWKRRSRKNFFFGCPYKRFQMRPRWRWPRHAAAVRHMLEERGITAVAQAMSTADKAKLIRQATRRQNKNRRTFKRHQSNLGYLRNEARLPFACFNQIEDYFKGAVAVRDKELCNEGRQREIAALSRKLTWWRAKAVFWYADEDRQRDLIKDELMWFGRNAMENHDFFQEHSFGPPFAWVHSPHDYQGPVRPYRKFVRRWLRICGPLRRLKRKEKSVRKETPTSEFPNAITRGQKDGWMFAQMD